jgi:DNA-binding NarL/FixJ family response regulator
VNRHDVITAFGKADASARLTLENSAVVRVAIVEPRNLMRKGIEKVLAGGSQFSVVAMAADASDLDMPSAGFDVIVCGLPPYAGDVHVESLGDLAEHGRVLILSRFGEGVRLTDVLRIGAYGCVADDADDAELLFAVDTVGRGDVHISPSLVSRLRTELCRPRASAPSVLGRREMETLRWLAMGLTHSQIGVSMGLTETTVNTYVKRIRAKLNVGNKAGLTRIAVEWGLLGDEAGERQRVPSVGPRPDVLMLGGGPASSAQTA